MEVIEKLDKVLKSAILKSFPDAKIEGLLVEVPKQSFSEGFGDFASAAALRLAKSAGKNPMIIAEEILKKLETPEIFERPFVVKPGFINFSFKKEFLVKFASEILQNPEILKPDIGKNKTVVTDISHPNVAKPMGVHHLLSTVIGDALNRLLTYCGYKVIRDNYLGDWGTQFGKLICAYKKWGDSKVVAENPIPELLKLYVKFHDEVEKNPALEEEGRAEFKKLEEGDAENKKLWQWVVELSLKEFHKIWNTFGVKFDFIHGESFYENMMQSIVDAGVKKKIFTIGEKGALICEFPDEKYPPAVVRKSDGATLYATRDLARINYWEKTWHPALMVNVVDVAQKLYFQQLFAMSQKLGLTKALNVHVAFGRMAFPEKRMSTRKGNIVLLEEVVDEAVALARKIVEEKNPDLSEKQKEEVSRMVGIGALKFAVLIQNRETNLTFKWEKMLSLEGESAPYMQYAYARAKSILRKAEKAGSSTSAVHENLMNSLIEKEEIETARMLPKFTFAVEQSIADFRPNNLGRYLSELASKFNSFYNACPVLQAESGEIRACRLQFVSAVAFVLKIGLNLLGIDAPEEM